MLFVKYRLLFEEHKDKLFFLQFGCNIICNLYMLGTKRHETHSSIQFRGYRRLDHIRSKWMRSVSYWVEWFLSGLRISVNGLLPRSSQKLPRGQPYHISDTNVVSTPSTSTLWDSRVLGINEKFMLVQLTLCGETPRSSSNEKCISYMWQWTFIRTLESNTESYILMNERIISTLL